jgi:peptide/nickel transport system permease protein
VTRSPFARLVARRILLGLLTLLLVSLVVFLATQALPGNAARAVLGRQATAQELATLSRQLHLDQPLVTQYGRWISGVVSGSFGNSLVSHESVATLLHERLLNSGFLILVAGLIAIPSALLIGVLSAIRRDTPFDDAVVGTSLVFAALPEFVIAILGVLVFATAVLHVLPAIAVVPPDAPIWQYPSSVVLPAAALVLAVAPYISRMMRGSMIDVLESDYVQMARLKGLSEWRVIWRHAVPNALVPAIQVSALQLAWMAGGVVTVEYVFNYPGIGSALVSAVDNRDIPVVQAITLLIGALYVVLNLSADVICLALTPKARTSTR